MPLRVARIRITEKALFISSYVDNNPFGAKTKHPEVMSEEVREKYRD